MNDDDAMALAIDEAWHAASKGDVPIGAVVVQNGTVIAQAHNEREVRNDPTAHAEILALQKAAQIAGSWILDDCKLYVTLEPCPMCAGALVNARIAHVIYGAPDPKAGAVDSLYDICRDTRLNHRLDVTAGIRADECAELLTNFFTDRRN